MNSNTSSFKTKPLRRYVAVFITCSVSFFASCYTLSWWRQLNMNNSSYAQGRSQLADCRVLTIGSSHFNFGVDPRELVVPSCNLTHPGMDAAMANALLCKSLPHLTLKCHTVVLELDVVSIFSNTLQDWKFDFVFPELGLPAAEYPTDSATRLYWRIESSVPFCRPHITPGSIHLYWSQSNEPVIPGYSPSTHVARPGDGAATALKHLERLNRDNKSRNLNATLKAISAAKRHGLRVILLVPPKPPGYWQHMNSTSLGAEFSGVVDYLEDLTMITVIDGRSVAELTLDERYFADGHHLNTRGAKALTAYLNSVITQSISGP